MLHVFIKLLIFYDEIEYLTPIVWTEDNEKEHLHGHVALNNGRLHKQQLQYSSIFFIVHLYEKINERHWIQSTNTHGFKQFLSYILQETKLSTATVHVATSGVPIDLNLIKSLHLQYSS